MRAPRLLLGGLMAVTLSACSQDGGAALNLLPKGLGSLSQRAPLVSAQMMKGAITIAPPDGFCIDPISLRQDFALLARCDVLGGGNGALDASLGIITVSLAPQGPAPLTLEMLAAAKGDALTLQKTFDETYDGGRFEVAQAIALAKTKGLDNLHWRAVTSLNGHDVSMALLAHPQSPSLGKDGRRMLRSLVARSHDATLANVVASEIQPKKVKTGLAATLSGLFN